MSLIVNTLKHVLFESFTLLINLHIIFSDILIPSDIGFMLSLSLSCILQSVLILAFRERIGQTHIGATPKLML